VDAYLDIETTGLDTYGDKITVIGTGLRVAEDFILCNCMMIS
jgi:uncharacterized protein YprB with RNaseH-like and TPR domain